MFVVGFVGFASSRVGEDSLSHHVDPELGQFINKYFKYFEILRYILSYY